MNAEEFLAWRKSLDLTQAGAADALGLGHRTVQKYESGELEIPKTVALAVLSTQQAAGMRDVIEKQWHTFVSAGLDLRDWVGRMQRAGYDSPDLQHLKACINRVLPEIGEVDAALQGFWIGRDRQKLDT